MINSFQIKNLRSIQDSGVVELKKITVLVGRNSSGKSTILRALPLLRQSVEQRTKGPILWYGRLVDFGDFRNAVREGDAARGITFGFGVTITPKRRAPSRTIAQQGEWLVPSRQGIKTLLNITIGRSPDDRVGHVRSLSAQAGNDSLEIKFDRSGAVESIVAMDDPVLLRTDEEWWVGRGEVVPEILLLEENHYQIDEDEYESFKEPVDRPFGNLVDQALSHITHGNTSPERLSAIGSKLLYGSEADFYRQLLNAPGVTASLQQRLRQLGSAAQEIRGLRRAVMMRHLSSYLKALDDELIRFARAVRYIEPIRASAERYYREQDLAVDDLDSSGANTAMFLSSLDHSALLQLQNWMTSNFGFRVYVESGTGHIQIKISQGDGDARNIADLGFGYSQLLPIILQLWRGTRTAPGDATPTLAVEQPELHLHPHYQAMLADVMVSAVASRRSSIIIETHSDHFINRLGALAAEQKIDPDDVQILFVAENEFSDSIATKVSFDSEGVLSEEWPVGFFTPHPAS